jgi:signal transduction histidine kinase
VHILETGSATLLEDSHFNSHTGQAIVVPMIDADGPIGVLTLLYTEELDTTTLPVLLARASTFGDLAAIALRKARLLEQSEERRRKLEALEQSRARLLRGFSHDIKNPLSNADGFLQLLELGLRGPLAPQQLATLQRARTALSAGLRMLRDLLDFAVASVGTHLPHHQPGNHRRCGERSRRESPRRRRTQADRAQPRRLFFTGAPHRHRSRAPGARQPDLECREIHE